ncbi:MAG: hypothetical protein ACWA40_03295 [Planktomarina sp.]
MQFRKRNLESIANCIIGENDKFEYRSGKKITEFFDDCGIDFIHDGSTRCSWTSDRLSDLLSEPQEMPNTLPSRFVHVLRVLMQKADAADDDPERKIALQELNKPLGKEGYEAFYGDDQLLYIRHTGTQRLSIPISPHRPFTRAEIQKRDELKAYLDQCSEDELIEEILQPLFRQLGFQRVSAAGHKDKALEYGKDLWMKYVLPTQHVLYFGLQVKKGKLDAAGASKGSNSNVSEIHNQVLMMLGHEIFDPEVNKKVLVDHAFIVAGGEITKQAKNWLGGKLDAPKRSQILFMDREDILNLYVVSKLPIPDATANLIADEIPF